MSSEKRSGETREGYVPVGRRGWLKVGGKPGPTEVQFVTPNWHKALLANHKEAKDAGEVKDAADAKGSSIQDKAAEGSTILGEDWYHHLKRLEEKSGPDDARFIDCYFCSESARGRCRIEKGVSQWANR